MSTRCIRRQGDRYLQPEFFARFDGNAKTVAGTVGGVMLPHPRQNPNGTAESLATLAKSQFGNQILLVTFAPGRLSAGNRRP